MTLYEIPTNVWKALGQTRKKIQYMSASGIDATSEQEIMKILIKDHTTIKE